MKQVVTYLSPAEHAALKERAREAKRSLGAQLLVEALTFVQRPPCGLNKPTSHPAIKRAKARNARPANSRKQTPHKKAS